MTRRQGGVLLAALGAMLAGAAHAGDLAIPTEAEHCGLRAPPADAGAYVTPGGFLLVHPRSRAIPGDYTGCKSLWVVQGPGRAPLLMRLYFSNGILALAEAYDGRGTSPAPRVICAVPDHRPECQGLGDNPLMELHTPTWPRVCMERPELPACAKDPE